MQTDLTHEPPVPGWSPRPPDAVLKQSRLEAHRLRRLERLAEHRPDLHGRLTGWQQTSRQLWDRVLPRHDVLAVTVAVLTLTVFDAGATLLLVGLGVAVEANPLLVALAERVGLVQTMLVRVLVGAVLTIVLAWLATWRREVRSVLALVSLILAAVACLHIFGLMLAVV